MNRRSFLKSTPLALTAAAVGVPAIAAAPLKPALPSRDDVIIELLTSVVITGFKEVLSTGTSVGNPAPREISSYKPHDRERVSHILNKVSDNVWNWLWTEDLHVRAMRSFPLHGLSDTCESQTWWLLGKHPVTGKREQLFVQTIQINFYMPQDLHW